MSGHKAHLLDLPNEILFFILKKLENVDVLYSLLGINNQRIDIITQEPIFSKTLNFVSASQTSDEISSISGSILDRFCIDILPKIEENVLDITNNLPNIVFNSVTHLLLHDKYPFKHEFFIRLARAFPFLKNLSINTILPPNWRCHEYHLRDKDWCSIVEYPHLISLDIYSANSYYAEHFLNETKTHLPRLTELKIRYEDLEMVTKNFTRNETRRICAKVKRLIVKHCIVYPKDVYHYFPLL
jgi:hypothetical protein